MFKKSKSISEKTGKYFSLLLLALASILGWYSYQAWARNRLVHRDSRPFDLAALLELEPFGEFEPERHLAHDISVVYYFSELSCTTCTERELVTVASWYERFADRANFILVVHGQDPLYLRQLRRIGRVRYPILLETGIGQLGFETTTIAIVDQVPGLIVARYTPKPDERGTQTAVDTMEKLLNRALAHHDAMALQLTGQP